MKTPCSGGILVVSSSFQEGMLSASQRVNVGAVTALAASQSARTIVGFRIMRPTVSATVLDAVGEQKELIFGNVEGGSGSFALASANMVSNSLPPIIIGPQGSALIYIWTSSTTPVTPQYAPEVGFWVR